MPDQNYQKLMQLLGGKDYRKIENPPYMNLSVERVGPDQISLCHYGEQNGDLMRDPEVVFLLQGETARPVYYRNDYAGVEHATVEGHFGDVPVQERQQKSLDNFVSGWFKELKSAGYFQQAERGAEVEQAEEKQEHDHERER